MSAQPHDATDTIVAVATGAGAGGIGVVRISGRDARRIGRALCGRPLRVRRVEGARFRDASGETIDRGLALAFAAPKSFTGEDVVELHAHGARVVLEQLVACAIAHGARHARPGEFSERAFLNGKLDLVQAEAIADLVAASSAQQARAAQRSLAGEFSRRIRTALEALGRLRVHVEAAIDFPDEEGVDFLADARIAEALASLRNETAATLDEARRGMRLTDGLHVVIVGRPNAGKSSLLNALAGEERAIVTAIAGTTRDVLRETIHFDGIELTLVDTAGLRATDDVVEAEGVKRARAELARADLALLVLDATRGDALRDDYATLAREVDPATPKLALLNKSDLHAAPHDLPGAADTLAISAHTGEGIAALRERLRRHAGANEAGGSFSARARHVAALERCSGALARAADVLATTRAGELVAEELRQAQHALSEITGDYTSDDLLGAIFSSFCIGK